MKTYPKYTWLEKDGIAFCELKYKDMPINGTAECHPEDQDVKSKLTGETIAEYRALIKYIKFVRDYELRPQLQALNHLYHCMKNSKHFNKKSYEAKSLFRQIHLLEKDIEEIQGIIKTTEIDLQNYITKKEKDHKVIREKIAERQLDENNQ